jgi:hypothetical protein
MAEAGSGVSRKGAACAPLPRISPNDLQDYARSQLTAAARYAKDRLHRRDFRLPRLELTVWSSSEAFLRICQMALHRAPPESGSAALAEVFLIDAGAPGWEPPARWGGGPRVSSRELGNILAAGGLRGFYHDQPPSWQFYSHTASRGIFSLVGPSEFPPWETGSPLRLFLHWIYARAGLRLTHAATLGLDGRGALVVGPGGSGKSGTVLAGLMHGLDSVGDDYVLVERSPRIVAHAIFDLLKQNPAGLQRARLETGPRRGPLNWQGKVELEASDLCGRNLASKMDICALLLPKISRSQRTTIEAVSKREAALALMPSGVLQLSGDQVEGIGFLAHIARNLPAFRVSLSEDPVEIADAIKSFLSKRMSS